MSALPASGQATLPASGQATLSASGQAPAPAGPAAPAEVQIVTTRLADNLYAIDGQGGRIGILTGPDGVFMVDSQFPQVAERIAAAIRQISPAPIKFLVNTHVHADHTGGNEYFGKLGATIIARPMLRQRLLKPAAPPTAAGTAPAQPPAAAPAVALPVMIYDVRVTVHLNGEGIELIPLPAAHTDGDTAVRFPAADALMTGDVFRSAGFPNIDRNNGGSLAGMLTAFDTLLAASGPATKVIPGHGPITNRAAIAAHRDMAVVLRDRVSKLIAQGQTQAQIIAAKITSDYDGPTGNVAGSADRFVGQLYAELGGK
jgi:glyoxylase-like metal-dependent hydrolase (beta-lactamase superfamily II)